MVYLHNETVAQSFTISDLHLSNLAQNYRSINLYLPWTWTSIEKTTK